VFKNFSGSSAQNNPESRRRLRANVYLILETAKHDNLTSRAADIFLITLIATNVIAVVLESLPEIAAVHGPAFHWFDRFTILVFSLEYLLRLWSIVERDPKSQQPAIAVRLRYVFSFHAVVDLLAIAPFYLATAGLLNGFDTRFLRAIRLLRILKLSRYSSALNMLILTIKDNGRALAAAFIILLIVMLMAASGMYYFERNSQPHEFGSIPAAMWWAFSTLTTVGYGDVTPITVGGKIFGALVTVVGLGMVALPTGILASAYNQQLRLRTGTFRERVSAALDDGYLSRP